MEQRVGPTRKIQGELIVPGELLPAEQALILAALSSGEGRIRNLPPGIERSMGILRELGLETGRKGRELTVQGKGLRGFTPADGVLDLRGMGETALLLIGLLAGQEFSTRVRLDGDEGVRCRSLLEMLESMGAVAGQETEEVFAVGGAEMTGIAHEALDVDPAVKLALLLAGLNAAGTTSLCESAGNRNRMERFLRERQVVVERRRREEGDGYLVSIEGGQEVQPCEVEIPGDLNLAYPLMVPALVRRGSRLLVRKVALRSGERGFLDLLRQIGGEIAIEDLGDDTADIEVSFSKQLKPTRVAGQRTEKVSGQVALLAVLATQTMGEFVIRDIDPLRRGDFDCVSYLFEQLKLIGARVGEYPEGLVIKGGLPLQGNRIDCRGMADLAMAFAAAGLLAHGEMVIEGAESLEPVYPDFFSTLQALKS